MKNNKIIFTNTTELNLDMPEPASKLLPDWYKKHDSYIENNKKIPPLKGGVSGTIKKCMPVFDVLNSGYIIKTEVDIYVEKVISNGKKINNFIFNSLNYVTSHNKLQANVERKNVPEEYIPKISNVWGIKTPKGYSCLFIPPVHRDNLIEIFPGIVDTDNYNVPVEFPFILSDPDFEGLIPMGTPIAQVIPFKRDKWKSYIGNDINHVRKQEIQTHRMFFDRYKKLFWDKKQYL
jgi:hypothetical protein